MAAKMADKSKYSHISASRQARNEIFGSNYLIKLAESVFIIKSITRFELLRWPPKWRLKSKYSNISASRHASSEKFDSNYLFKLTESVSIILSINKFDFSRWPPRWRIKSKYSHISASRHARSEIFVLQGIYSDSRSKFLQNNKQNYIFQDGVQD